MISRSWRGLAKRASSRRASTASSTNSTGSTGARRKHAARSEVAPKTSRVITTPEVKDSEPAIQSSGNADGMTASSPPYTNTAESVIRTAVILLRKLSGDIVPLILDNAEMWIPLVSARTDTYVSVDQNRAGIVVLECKLPVEMPANVARRLRVTTSSRDQGWSSYPKDQGTYGNSWTWFEVGVVSERRQVVDGAVLRKRIITNVHAGREWKTHEAVWDLSSQDPEICAMIGQLKGGDVIQLSIWARYPGWMNRMQTASIEVEGNYVRKL